MASEMEALRLVRQILKSARARGRERASEREIEREIERERERERAARVVSQNQLASAVAYVFLRASYPWQLTVCTIFVAVPLCRTGEQDAEAKEAAEAAVSEMAAKLESSKSDLRHAEERLVAAVRARKELQAKLEGLGSSRPVGHSTVAAWPPPLAQYS